MSAWSYSSLQYVQSSVSNVEEFIAKNLSKNWKMPSKAKTPLKSTYQPEVDGTQELEATDTSYYQFIIGVLTWIVKLGHVDICLEVSMMSLHLALPRTGHLDQVFQIFVYLKKYHNTKLVYDPSNPVVGIEKFER